MPENPGVHCRKPAKVMQKNIKKTSKIDGFCRPIDSQPSDVAPLLILTLSVLASRDASLVSDCS